MRLCGSDDQAGDSLHPTQPARHQAFAQRLTQLENAGYRVVERDDVRLEATVQLRGRSQQTADTWRRIWFDAAGTLQDAPTLNPTPGTTTD